VNRSERSSSDRVLTEPLRCSEVSLSAAEQTA
jgi:hypothetical protein